MPTEKDEILSDGSECSESRFIFERVSSPADASAADENESESREKREREESGHPVNRLIEIQEHAKAIEDWFENEDIILLMGIADLMALGLTATEAIDYVAVEECGYSQTEWGELTGERSRQTVNDRVSLAKRKLGTMENDNA